MIKLQMSLAGPGCAQGKYGVKAKGCILAILRWGSGASPLSQWSPFAYVPIDPAGNGTFFFSGRRGIPPEATHVWARCYGADFSAYEDAALEIPEPYRPPIGEPEEGCRFSVLTDLHLSSKPWKIKGALRSVESDVVFLLGDATNDGLPEQFASFRACIRETVPHKTIFPVIGNHDVPYAPEGDGADGGQEYQDFQKQLLARAAEQGHCPAMDDENRAYAVKIGDLDVIGLQCVTTGRKFRFPNGRQLDWLEARLGQTPASWHILLCHAPLLAHHPNRRVGTPYLEQNKRLQALLDRTGRCIFLSGHTHISPNALTGNGEWDAPHQNLYLDCGSVTPTDLSDETGLMAPDWKDGCRTELRVARDDVEIRMISIQSGVCFSRGYYHFRVG